MASNISSNMEIPQKIDDKPMEKYLNKHVRPELCKACDLNPQAWKDLGTGLMPDAAAELSIISQDRRDSVVNRCSSMFQLWFKRQPNASWKQLIKALREIDLNTLAAQIEGMLKPSVDPAAAGASVLPVMPVETVDGLDSSGDTCVKRHVNENVLDYLHEKYITLTTNLKKVFKEKEDHYSAEDIIFNLCTADKKNLTFFSTSECFHTVKTMGEVFHFIGRECKYFDYALLKTFVYGSECEEAIALMDDYIKEVDSIVITGLNLQSEQTESSKNGAKKFEIFYDKDELDLKELNVIREALRRCFHLPRASILFTAIVNNCIIIVCHIPLAVQDHLLQLRLTTHQLKPLSALHITALIVDGSMKLSMPMDCDTEDVILWTPCIKKLTDTNQGMISEKGEVEITIALTGVSGSGKNVVANFFLKQETHIGFGLATKKRKLNVGMVGGKLTKFVDAPWLMDPDIKSDDEFGELANALFSIPNGIHALGVVIKIGNISSKDVRILENCLALIEIIPYVFVIFSNAYFLSSAYEEQQCKLNILLNTNDTLKSLQKLLTNIDNRYMILESVLNKEESYYNTKVVELMKTVDSIYDKQKKPFTCFLNDTARQLLQSNASQTERINALIEDLKSAQGQLIEQHQNLLDRTMIFFGGGAGAVAGTVIGIAFGPAGSVAGGVLGATMGAGAVSTLLGIKAKINKCRTQ